LSAPNFTRGFYTTEHRLRQLQHREPPPINRGPNAILFGVGSPAGVVDTSLLRPNLRRPTNKIEVRYGDNDSLRESIDFNRVLVKGSSLCAWPRCTTRSATTSARLRGEEAHLRRR
jgi:hypothetical protein